VKTNFVRKFIIVFVFCFTSCIGFAINSVEYDGSWWLETSKEERVAFIEGYLACYISKIDRVRFQDTSFVDFESKVTKYITQHKSVAKKDLNDILMMYSIKQNIKYRLISKDYDEDYDGGFWLGNPDIVRKGFIEGYIVCAKRYLKNVKLTQTPDYYVKRISTIYDVEHSVKIELTYTKVSEILLNIKKYQ